MLLYSFWISLAGITLLAAYVVERVRRNTPESIRPASVLVGIQTAPGLMRLEKSSSHGCPAGFLKRKSQ
jgi:hypothetical protein